ncbi:semaphorin-3F isoform X1 [Crotalus tigris]|uniref:semaphorin-3F isoform X1 n=1 Tax=Crotalus tigris TaxID=88082 RepID=UPI00192F2593|nr:semaphorin-3F isoform X1 [Crotalus tigris]XP_039189684.1 semaphorin-3F isoform X1 [Crotalus tigris]XP_039189689.1 semaphorin-3F isoform X1 [Crotalus tigris]XP_039189696.1 semaphorin-3F isoform X1 [Crotalus tigris]
MPLVGFLLWAILLIVGWWPSYSKDYLFATPRVQLTFKELKATGTARFFNFLLNSTDYRILLKDEDHDRMYVGSKDYILSLDLHDINREPLIIHWPASQQRIDECVLSGKNNNGECGNFIRLIQPWNRTHLYVCGTGAYNPVCIFVNRGRKAQAFELNQSIQQGGRGSRAVDSSLHPSPVERKDYIFYLEPEKLESGKGKCSYDPKVDTVSALINEELYAGVYIDFMGTDAAIFRTLGKQTAMRTDQYNSRWLNDPAFVHAKLIPDSAEKNDDKLYFFFREKSTDSPQSPVVYSRIGRICLNDDGGHCCLVNKWSTFLKARLICSVPGPDGIETHFDELQDVFIQQTQDVKNPIIYAVFAASGSVFKGSAVCVYSMADIRMVFNGPFAHKEGPNYQWMPYTGKMPYPRPGTCPGGTFTPLMKSTKDYPDEVINFMRTHPMMYNGVYPIHRQPLVVRTNVKYKFTTIAVDQVDAADGRYEVLFLGTDRGTVQKVIVLPKDDLETEELMLEEVEVFKIPAPIKTMTISSKRQQLYVSSAIGLTHLALHRCDVYGEACADCCLARDPYCAWDGKSCSRYSASSKRRSRRQDIRHGNPIRQCRGYNSNASKNSVEAVQYGVEGSTAFLECQPRSPQATIKWLLQRDTSDRRKELRTDGRVLRTDQGLLLRSLQLSDGGLYSCTATENNFKHTVAKVQLHVLSSETVHAVLFQSEAPVPSAAAMRAGLPGTFSSQYHDLVQLLTQPEMGLINQYCQGYWRHVASNHKEILAGLKAKELHDQKKPRNRRNHQPEMDQHT